MAAAANTAAIFVSPSQPLSSKRGLLYSSRIGQIQRRFPRRKLELQVKAVATTLAPLQEIKEYKLPSWAMFEMGTAPVFWKTMNGLPPTAGEKLKLFYNPAASKLTLDEDYGVAFNGGFNQPIMCGGEPRTMLKKDRGKADSPIYTMQICIPKHAVNLIFSFTNGVDWDGPYRLQFQVPKKWQNKPIEFFNEGLAKELSQDGACERAIFPDSNVVVTRCAMIGNLTVEGIRLLFGHSEGNSDTLTYVAETTLCPVHTAANNRHRALVPNFRYFIYLMEDTHTNKKIKEIQDQLAKELIEKLKKKKQDRIIELSQVESCNSQGEPTVTQLTRQEINDMVLEETRDARGRHFGLGSITIGSQSPINPPSQVHPAVAAALQECENTKNALNEVVATKDAEIANMTSTIASLMSKQEKFEALVRRVIPNIADLEL